MSVSEGTITRWLKQVGEHVAADETIVEISTDKVDTEVPSPGEGIVTEILVAEGETVDVGTRIAVIGGDGGAAPAAPAPAPVAEAAPAPVPQPAPAPAPVAAAPEPASQNGHDHADDEDTDGEARSFMSPVVARMVSEHALDIGRIAGTGRGGRVTKKDVEQYLEARESTPAPAPAAPTPAPVAAAPAPAAPGGPRRRPCAEAGRDDRRLVRRRGALAALEHPQGDRAQHAPVGRHRRAGDVGQRGRHDPRREHPQGAQPALPARLRREAQFMPFIMRAVIEAIPLWPWVNAEIRGDSVVVKRLINLGVAVSIDDAKGLVVPVIHNAEEHNLLGLTRALTDLADRGRKKQLSADEMAGGTLTITNPGASARSSAPRYPAAAGRDPRRRSDRQARRGGDRRARQRLDRDPADDAACP